MRKENNAFVGLSSLYLRAAWRSRVELDAYLKSYIKKRFDRPIVRRDLASLLNEPTIICPAVQIETAHPLVDVICCALQNRGNTLLLLEVRRGVDTPEGIGKTQALLELIGLSPDETALPHTLDDVQRIKKFTFIEKKSDFQLIASDMAFFTSYRKRLVFTPALGERLLALWDVARCLFRLIDPAYFPGKHRTPEGRKILRLILEKIPYELFAGRFVDKFTYFEPKIIIVLDRLKENTSKSLVLEDLDIKTRIQLLKKALENPIYHKSTFWARQKQLHRQYVEDIISSLAFIPMLFYAKVGKTADIVESVKRVKSLLE
jgi:hypothetical protein